MDFSTLFKKFTDFFITATTAVYAIFLGYILISDLNLEKIKSTIMYTMEHQYNIFGFTVLFIGLFSILFSLGSAFNGFIAFIKSPIKFIFNSKKEDSVCDYLEKKWKKLFTEFFNSKMNKQDMINPRGENYTRNDIREITNANIAQYWIIDFLETNYKLHLTLSIISFIGGVLGFKFVGAYAGYLLIISLFQYISACDYKESFDASFSSVWNAILFNKTINSKKD